MPPQLRQLNVSYVDVQDRLFLKVSTSEDQEYRVWCTRRFTRLLLDRMEESFEKEMFDKPQQAQAVKPAAVPEQARREVAQMQHKQAVKEESFQQDYDAEPVEYPLGEEGLLVTTLKFKNLDDGSVALHLGDNKGKGLSLNLNDELKHQLYELFSRASERADWFSGPAAAAATAGAAVVH